MGLIEQAAQRLEELRRAGAEVPAHLAPAPTPAAAAAASASAAETPPVRASHRHAHGAPSIVAVPRAPTGPEVKIDLQRLHAQGYITPDAPRSRIAEEFRILKRPLIANARNRLAGASVPSNLVMVTSAMPGEGKTFTAVNLAMSLAMELDQTVLLIDGDVARPSVPTVLGVKHPRGLLDVLGSAACPLDEVVLRTNVPKLSLLLAGSPHAGAVEMLASQAMSRLLDEIAHSSQDRIVIVDSPPLLATTEARALASHMGQLIMVVRAESALQSQVKAAVATVESCPIKTLVLNGATSPGQGVYGYGYGY